ncbi:DUF397 domain-containing protein [Actinomadura alba]|uniref:DUF397 domain-containing protein n=1 Tax=Actinomadura alba TaxID=406431 RepID=A0ABR7M1R7_9ACTN|nr:DUF397 domain-containing protein [Actinomadura alba]MBC6471009.1 DUF397 domain-containing protein [Actinomadura alba]
MSRSRELSDAAWRKSSRSGGQGECVEIASVGDVIAVRDSKSPDGPWLAFDHAAWAAFARLVRSGEHDL